MHLVALFTATALGLVGASPLVGSPAKIRVVARAVGRAAELQINDEPQ
jgi:hypothetical protein